ncbi:hypothetical protein N7478_002799 [Penicillium angulare]|uniref:uncharacterized protein n=1 Tax=Penicillium angulare TaxID=116970 RepID=UPI00254183D5|nr:uncharacterized protein N7478_002799 [Penicillium angulare]KAJ5287113.1 hypothetical protein N7478_002799 [Penicillium angulare]
MPGDNKEKALPTVPRSKGCLTCVTRKIRCDGRKPTCYKCEKRKQECGGYRREEIIFLSEGWRPPGVKAKARIKTIPDSANRLAQVSVLRALTGSENMSDPVLYICPSIERSHLHIPFFLSSFGTQPFQAPAIADVFHHYFCLISSNLRDGTTQTSSLRRPVIFAVDALAQGHFGAANTDPVSVQRSLQSYTMALGSMSTQLAQLKCVGPGLRDISEDNWQHLAFFCIVMMFWEILQTLSARQPSLLPDNYWKQRYPMRSTWLNEMKTILEETENPKFRTNFELYTSTDSLMIEVNVIVSIMAQYDQLLTEQSFVTENQDSVQLLLDMYNHAELILSRNELRLKGWKAYVSEVTLSSWLSLHPEVGADPISADFWSIINGGDDEPYFDIIFSFRAMMEYHALTLYWTIVMTIRLLLSDLLTLLVKKASEKIPANAEEQIKAHHAQLMKYSLNVLQAICYATLSKSRAVAPFFFASSFQLTVLVLDRECKYLQADEKSEVEIRRCEGLKSLAIRYLDWASQNKIPVKLDLNSPWVSRTFLTAEKRLDDAISKQDRLGIEHFNYENIRTL